MHFPLMQSLHGLRYSSQTETGLYRLSLSKNLPVAFCLRVFKTEIAKSATGPKLQGPFAENALVTLHIEQKMLVTFDSRSQSSWCVNLETITSIWATQWMQPFPCKTKCSQKAEKIQKFLEPTSKPKVISTENSLEFGKACEELPIGMHIRRKVLSYAQRR